jgi:hypothetical protein
MPIQTQSLLSPLSSLHPFKMDIGGDTEQLKLMREQFEETKRRNREDERLRQLAEEQAKAREQMITDRQNAKAKTEADAAMLKQKQEALQKFGEANGKGDIEGARAMVPYMSQLGMSVDLEGEANGLPRYRIYMSPEEKAQAQQQQGLGYPTDDAEPMTAPAGIGSTAEAFQRAQQAMPGLAGADSGKVTSDASETPVDLNQPMVEPGATNFKEAKQVDEPDYTGSVPKNVIDMSATQAQTLARLSPYLAGQIGAYPEAYQDSAKSTAGGIPGLGLPLSDAIKTFQDSRRSPDSLIQADIAAQAQAGNQQATRDAARIQQAQERANSGTKAVQEAAQTFNIKDIWERRRSTAQTLEVLKNNDPTDDYLAGANISRMMGERGATSDPDVERALGNAAPSFFDRLKNRMYHEAIGGLSVPQRAALIRVLNKSVETDKRRTFDFLDNTDEQLASGKNDPDFKRGIESQRDLLTPRDWREEYAAEKKKRSAASKGPDEAQPFNMEEDSKAEYGGGKPSPLVEPDFDAELKRQTAAAGLNYDAVKNAIQVESGGKASAQNPSGATGLIQFMPGIAKAMGTTTEELKKMSAAEQIPYVVRYFQERNLGAKHDAGDYYVAVAAGGDYVGKPDSTVVYPKGSKGWEQNAPWRPADGGDITVGSIKAFGAKSGGSQGTQTAALSGDAADRIRQALKRNGY